jgi:hypothetical protein
MPQPSFFFFFFDKQAQNRNLKQSANKTNH